MRPPVPFSTAHAMGALWLGAAALLVACQSTPGEPAATVPAGTPPVATGNTRAGHPGTGEPE